MHLPEVGTGMPQLSDQEIEAIERATVEAVAPDEVLERSGWLLPLDPGTVGRAHSAVPLMHDPQALVALAQQVPDIVALYRGRGLKPKFRIPEDAAALEAALQRWGAVGVEPTWVMTGEVSHMARLPSVDLPGLEVVVQQCPDGPWQGLFLGEGFDPVDGASRVRNLSRAPDSLYVSARLNGETVACGAASFRGGWMGVHGMRTVLALRGRGLASAVLRQMATCATERGVKRVYLQVGASNPAKALYERAGLVTAWRYQYWHIPD